MRAQVADGEKVGVKAWKMLGTKIRCYFEQEMCHPFWNDTSTSAAMCMFSIAAGFNFT
jgi:hypothetical protein